MKSVRRTVWHHPQGVWNLPKGLYGGNGGIREMFALGKNKALILLHNTLYFNIIK